MSSSSSSSSVEPAAGPSTAKRNYLASTCVGGEFSNVDFPADSSRGLAGKPAHAHFQGPVDVGKFVSGEKGFRLDPAEGAIQFFVGRSTEAKRVTMDELRHLSGLNASLVQTLSTFASNTNPVYEGELTGKKAVFSEKLCVGDVELTALGDEADPDLPKNTLRVSKNLQVESATHLSALSATGTATFSGAVKIVRDTSSQGSMQLVYMEPVVDALGSRFRAASSRVAQVSAKTLDICAASFEGDGGGEVTVSVPVAGSGGSATTTSLRVGRTKTVVECSEGLEVKSGGIAVVAGNTSLQHVAAKSATVDGTTALRGELDLTLGGAASVLRQNVVNKPAVPTAATDRDAKETNLNSLSHVHCLGAVVVSGRNNASGAAGTAALWSGLPGLQLQHNRDGASHAAFLMANAGASAGAGAGAGGFRFQRYKDGVFQDEPLAVGDTVGVNSNLVLANTAKLVGSRAELAQIDVSYRTVFSDSGGSATLGQSGATFATQATTPEEPVDENGRRRVSAFYSWKCQEKNWGVSPHVFREVLRLNSRGALVNGSLSVDTRPAETANSDPQSTLLLDSTPANGSWNDLVRANDAIVLARNNGGRDGGAAMTLTTWGGSSGLGTGVRITDYRVVAQAGAAGLVLMHDGAGAGGAKGNTTATLTATKEVNICAGAATVADATTPTVRVENRLVNVLSAAKFWASSSTPFSGGPTTTFTQNAAAASPEEGFVVDTTAKELKFKVGGKTALSLALDSAGDQNPVATAPSTLMVGITNVGATLADLVARTAGITGGFELSKRATTMQGSLRFSNTLNAAVFSSVGSKLVNDVPTLQVYDVSSAGTETVVMEVAKGLVSVPGTVKTTGSGGGVVVSAAADKPALFTSLTQTGNTLTVQACKNDSSDTTTDSGFVVFACRYRYRPDALNAPAVFASKNETVMKLGPTSCEVFKSLRFNDVQQSPADPYSHVYQTGTQLAVVNETATEDAKISFFTKKLGVDPNPAVYASAECARLTSAGLLLPGARALTLASAAGGYTSTLAQADDVLELRAATACCVSRAPLRLGDTLSTKTDRAQDDYTQLAQAGTKLVVTNQAPSGSLSFSVKGKVAGAAAAECARIDAAATYVKRKLVLEPNAEDGGNSAYISHVVRTDGGTSSVVTTLQSGFDDVVADPTSPAGSFEFYCRHKRAGTVSNEKVFSLNSAEPFFYKPTSVMGYETYGSDTRRSSLSLYATMSVGSMNPMVQQYDSLIVAHKMLGADSKGALTLSTWSTDPLGVRMDGKSTVVRSIDSHLTLVGDRASSVVKSATLGAYSCVDVEVGKKEAFGSDKAETARRVLRAEKTVVNVGAALRCWPQVAEGDFKFDSADAPTATITQETVGGRLVVNVVPSAATTNAPAAIVFQVNGNPALELRLDAASGRTNPLLRNAVFLDRTFGITQSTALPLPLFKTYAFNAPATDTVPINYVATLPVIPADSANAYDGVTFQFVVTGSIHRLLVNAYDPTQSPIMRPGSVDRVPDDKLAMSLHEVEYARFVVQGRKYVVVETKSRDFTCGYVVDGSGTTATRMLPVVASWRKLDPINVADAVIVNPGYSFECYNDESYAKLLETVDNTAGFSPLHKVLDTANVLDSIKVFYKGVKIEYSQIS